MKPLWTCLAAAVVLGAALCPLAPAGEIFPPPEGIEVLPLWPDGAPEAKGTDEADTPRIAVFPAPKETSTGAAVVVCPGGGYGGLAIGYEGYEVAQWLNRLGVTGVVLRYRVAPYRHPVPLGDAQRALRLVRSRAGEWGIDPDRIGILGFSAGGHLASTTGTHFDAGDPAAKDPVDRVSCRPDFLVLIYPVITFKPPYGHAGSGNNLLGKDPDPALLDLLANDERVTKETPPAFLVHSTGDSVVPVENSLNFYKALRDAKVPCELHVYERGEHGYGMGRGDKVLETWTGHCADWMRLHGWLDKP